MSLLPVRIVACTSEDRQHPVYELQNLDASSRGWQSAPFCDNPQVLVLRFTDRVTLTQVQVLSHRKPAATAYHAYYLFSNH